MFVKEYGSGERKFLCFHGWGGDHREFAPLFKRAPSDVCLMSVDLPGYGLSPKPEQWSMNAITPGAAAILRDRDIRSCTLIGFCSGIGPALMLAALEPDRVNRVVMIDPFALSPGISDFFFQVNLEDVPIQPLFKHLLEEKSLTGFLNNSKLGC